MRVFLLALLMSVACGKWGNEKEARRMEASLKQRTEQRLGVSVRAVECPRDVELDNGVRVTCFAQIEGRDKKVELSVRWHSEPARASMRLPKRWKLSAELRKQLAEKYQIKVDAVICPEEITSKKGVVVACAARVDGGAVPLTVEVTFTNDAGAYMWQDKGVVLLRQLESVVGESLTKRGRAGTVKCVGAVRSSQPGTTFRCPITFDEGGTAEVTVRVKSWEGDVGFEVE